MIGRLGTDWGNGAARYPFGVWDCSKVGRGGLDVHTGTVRAWSLLSSSAKHGLMFRLSPLVFYHQWARLNFEQIYPNEAQ
jgi:hypothetical protein